MSRCFAYPPPYFGQAQIESIKFDKENLSKDSKAERKRLKKELKKEKKLNESQESKLLKESRKRKYEELGLTTGSSKSSSKHKSKKAKDAQLERSGLSEEHGQASAQPVAKCDSPRSQDSSKRKGGAGAMPSPSPSLTNSGSTIRIKLPGGAKPKEQVQTPVSIHKTNSVPVPKPSAQVTKQNGISAPKPSFQTVKPNGVNNNSLPEPSAPKPNGIKTLAPVTKPGIKTPAPVQKPNGIITTPQASVFTTSKLNGIRSAPPFAKSNGVSNTSQTSSLAPKQNGVPLPKNSVPAVKPNGLSTPKPAAPVARTIPKGPLVRPSEMFAPKAPVTKPLPKPVLGQQQKPQPKPVLEQQQKPQPKPVLEQQQKPQPKPVLVQKSQPKPVLEQKPQPKPVLEQQVKPAGQMRPPPFRPVASKEPVVAPPVKREEKREIVHQKQILPLKRERESFPPPVQSVKTGRLSDPVVRREKESCVVPPAQIPKSKSAQALNAAPSVVANQEKKPVQALNAAPSGVSNQEKKPVQAFNAAPSGVTNQEKSVQAFNAAPSVVEKKLAVPAMAPCGDKEKPCFSGRKSETEKKHESVKKRESKHKSKHHHHKHHHKSERKSKRKEELCLYENLMASWQPLPLEEEPEDLDWLLPKRKVQKIEEKKEEVKEDKKEGDNLVVHANDGVQNYQTRATFMLEFNMFQLPFVVPF